METKLRNVVGHSSCAKAMVDKKARPTFGFIAWLWVGLYARRLASDGDGGSPADPKVCINVQLLTGLGPTKNDSSDWSLALDVIPFYRSLTSYL